MTDTFSCDYCRGTIDISTDQALLVAVHRRVDADEWGDEPDELVSGQQLTFRYCSQQHLGAHMERVPLPPVTVDESVSGVAVVGCTVLAVIFTAAAGLAVYGAIKLWQEVLQGWW